MKLFNQPTILSEFKYTPFFKLRFVTVLLVIQVFIVPVVQNHKNGIVDSAGFKAWLISGSLVLPIILGLIYGSRKIFVDLFEDKIPVRHILRVAFLIGFIKGFITYYLVNLMHIKDSFPLDEMLVRGFGGGILAMALTFGLTLRASLSDNHRMLLVKEKELDKIAQEIGALKGEISTLKSGSHDLMISRVIDRLRKRLDFDLLNSDPAKNWKQISLALRDELAQEVRSESYALTEFEHTNVKARNQLWHIFVVQQIHLAPITFSLINLAAGITLSYLDGESWGSFGQPLLNFISSFIIIYGFKKIQKNRENPSHLISHLVIFAAVATSCCAVLGLKYLLQDLYVVAPLYLIVPWQIFLMYSISTSFALIEFMNSRAGISADIQEDLEQKRIILENYHQRMRNDISTHLHGFLVSKVHKSSLRLENFGREQDFVKFDETLKTLLSEFTLDKFREGLKSDLIGPDFFKGCKESWDGIVCVEFLGDFDFPAYVHETTRVELAQVVEEIIANANRHGDATEVSIGFSWLDKERLEITAQDNGKGVTSGFKKGLGCSLYETASDGNWRLEGTEGIGTTLHMVIELWEHEARVETIAMESAASDLLERHSRSSY
jgi:hypothetical protein